MEKKQKNMTKEIKGIIFILISCVFMAVMTAVVRHISDLGMGSTELVFLRNIIAVFLLLGVVAVRREKPTLKINDIKLYFWRVVVGLAAMLIWFYCLGKLELAQATALSFSTPIFASINAQIFLGEKMGRRRWTAVIIGMLGTLIILRPSADMNHAALYVLFSCFLMSIALVLVKKMTATEKPFNMLFHMHLWMAAFSLPLAAVYWQPVSAEVFYWCILLAALSTVGHYTLIRSYSLIDVSLTVPFDFTRLVWASLIAYFAFAEVPDAYTYAGAAVIVTSAAYIAYRERVRKSR